MIMEKEPIKKVYQNLVKNKMNSKFTNSTYSFSITNHLLSCEIGRAVGKVRKANGVLFQSLHPQGRWVELVELGRWG